MRRNDEASTRLEHFRRSCRERGLAVTTQRQAIFAALFERRDHPTADQIHAAIRDRLPGVSRTTVYRVLETLLRAELISKVCHLDAVVRYDPCTHRHHHLVCLRCGSVADVDDPNLDAIPIPRRRISGFEVHDYSVHFRGICRRCRARSGATGGSGRRRGRPGASKPETRLREARVRKRRDKP